MFELEMFELETLYAQINDSELPSSMFNGVSEGHSWQNQK